MREKINFWPYLLVTSLIYASSLHFGFSQDDWYFLTISRASNLTEFLNFFNPWSQAGFAFFRPLGTQLYYFLSTLLLGPRAPLGMHIFMLLLQSFNGYLVTRLLILAKYRLPVSRWVGLLYALSSVHFLSLYYIAATQQLLAATFSLLSLIAFLEYKWSAGLYFFLALLSKETAIVTPAIAVLLMESKPLVRRFRSLLPYILVGGVYGLTRVLSASPTQTEYHFFFGVSVLTNLRWYLLFAANLPEGLVAYGLPRMGIDIMRFWADGGWSMITLSLGSLLILLLVILNFIKTKQFQLLVWFILALFPVLFLRNHLYPHYLDLGLIPFLLLLLNQSRTPGFYARIALYIATAVLSLSFSVSHHWTTGRAKMAETIINRLPWSELCTSNSLLFTGDARSVQEVSYTLSLANGPRVICRDYRLPVYYSGIDSNIPADSTPVDVSWISTL